MNDVYGRCQQGAPVVLRADAALTASYVTTASIDLFSNGGLFVHPVVGTSAVGTALIKHRWSIDGTNFGDQVTASVSSMTANEALTSVAATRLSVDLQRAGVYSPQFLPRQGRYYQSAVKWGAASTSATLAINVLPVNNMA